MIAGLLQACERSLREYKVLLSPDHGHSQQQAVCDRCLQPIDDATYHANVERMEADVASAAAERSAAVAQSSATQARPTHSTNLHRVKPADGALKALL